MGLCLLLAVALAVALAFLASYAARHRQAVALLQAQLRQRTDLQRRLMEGIPSDHCVYPHARSEIGYVLNPFMKAGTLWVSKEHPYPINSWGLRGAEIAPKPPGRKRIVLLGDSWFFGWQLRDEDRLENRMRAVLKDPAYEFVTVAIPGWNVRSEAAFLESRMPELDPDAIVWEICPNDIWQVGGVIPPGTLSWAFSPQNREPERNAFTVMNNPLPAMPFVVERNLANLGIMDRVRADYGIPVLAAPVDIPPQDWAFLAAKRATGLPTRFIPRLYAADRQGWVGENDSHPTVWMNEKLALGYLAKLAQMGVVPSQTLDAAQQAVVAEWERANAGPPAPDAVDAHVRSVMEQVPAAYPDAAGVVRVAAGADEEGRMGRRGLFYLRASGAPSAILLELDVPGYALRYRRQVEVRARTFEGQEAAGATAFSEAAQRVVGRVPVPAGASRFPVFEVEWLFNHDACPDPTGCMAARLVRAYSE